MFPYVRPTTWSMENLRLGSMPWNEFSTGSLERDSSDPKNHLRLLAMKRTASALTVVRNYRRGVIVQAHDPITHPGSPLSPGAAIYQRKNVLLAVEVSRVLEDFFVQRGTKAPGRTPEFGTHCRSVTIHGVYFTVYETGSTDEMRLSACPGRTRLLLLLKTTPVETTDVRTDLRICDGTLEIVWSFLTIPPHRLCHLPHDFGFLCPPNLTP